MDKLWQVSAEWTRGEEQRDHSLIKRVIPDAELLLVLNGHLRLLAPKRCGTYAFLFGSMREGVSQSGSLPKEWNVKVCLGLSSGALAVMTQQSTSPWVL